MRFPVLVMSLISLSSGLMAQSEEKWISLQICVAETEQGFYAEMRTNGTNDRGPVLVRRIDRPKESISPLSKDGEFSLILYPRYGKDGHFHGKNSTYAAKEDEIVLYKFEDDSFLVIGRIPAIEPRKHVKQVLRKLEEANQPVQRNASTGSVSNFESPARRG